MRRFVMRRTLVFIKAVSGYFFESGTNSQGMSGRQVTVLRIYLSEKKFHKIDYAN